MIRTLGWRKDKPDERDYTPDTPKVKNLFKLLRGMTLPETVDLRQYCSAIEDQGSLGSCTANAAAGDIELLEKKQYGRYKDHSRLFIYYNTRSLEGTINEDAGAEIRDTIKATRDKGACLESTWPYNINKFADKPPQNCYDEALNYQTLTYVSLSTLNDIKSSLAAGLPVQFGFLVFDSFWDIGLDGIMRIPDMERENLAGGHAVLVVGYTKIAGQEYLIIRNSWGSDWGKDGYFYMPVEYLNMKYYGYPCCDDFWVILTQEWVEEEPPAPQPYPTDCYNYIKLLKMVKNIVYNNKIGYSRRVTSIKRLLKDGCPEC